MKLSTKNVYLSVAFWGLMCLQLQAQSNFQAGYIVDSAGDTLYGEINNQDWMKNPAAITFRSTADSKEELFTPSELKGFYINGDLYKSAVVSIDETPYKIKTSTHNREIIPSSRKDTVFLSVLVQGEVSLYQYRHDRSNFYLDIHSQIVELISHEYTVIRNGQLFRVRGDADLFQSQLKKYAGYCNTRVGNIKYSEKALTKFVTSCNNNRNNPITFVREVEKPKLSVQLYSGVSSSTFDFSVRNTTHSFSNSENLTFGISAKMTLPRDRGRRSIFADVLLHKIRSYNTKDFNESLGGGYCINEHCFRYNTVAKISDMVLDANSLKFNLGYNYQLWDIDLSPFFNFGCTLTKLLDYEAIGTYDIKEYKFDENNNVTLENHVITQSEFLILNDWTFGGFLGAGIKYKQFSISGRYEMGYFTGNTSALHSAYLIVGFELPVN